MSRVSSRPRRASPGLVLVAVVASVIASVVGVPGPASGTARPALGGYGSARAAACADPAPGHVGCLARVRTAAGASTPPGGSVGPAGLAQAYGLTGTAGSGSVIAIVDAFSDPKAAADLAVYRSTYRLPACTQHNGCLRVVDQRGTSGHAPPPDAGWAVEISLDLDAASAACPRCSLLLVQADSDLATDLAASVDTAVRLGATVVSNSYGGQENGGMGALAAHYRHRGVTIVASSGDAGFGPPVSFPAVFGSVIAVGGTTLTKAPRTARGWTETAWAGAGSGCSAYVAKPAWQHDRRCGMRTVADVSAVADPASDVVAYDTFGLGADAGFVIVGGTSLAAPLVAAMIARSERPLADASWIYAHPAAFHDVTGGSNGYCGKDYLCTGRAGYDAPTGVGSPRGVAGL